MHPKAADSHSVVQVLRLYGRAGLTVQTILVDIEFESIKNTLEDKTTVNTNAAKEHVAEIERSIVYNEVMWANAFPNNKGVSQAFLPRALILRNNLDVTVHAR